MIQRRLVDYFKNLDIDLKDSLVAIGADGCALNTGKFGGIIRLLEMDLQKPLQPIICLFHLNELPLKALMRTFVGKSLSSKSYEGPLGRAILRDDLSTLPVADYKPISWDNEDETPFPRFDDEFLQQSLRSDQLLLYHLCLGAKMGSLKDGSDRSRRILSLEIPEPNQSRWLTTAARIIRLYLSTSDPTTIPSLDLMATYILKVYVPIFFLIKQNPLATSGPMIFQQLALRSRGISCNPVLVKGKELTATDVIDKVLADNSYFASVEWILTAMLKDEDFSIRYKAIHLIERARSAKSSKQRIQIRAFDKPKLEDINFNADHYTKLVDIETNPVEPPIVVGINDLTTFQILFPGHSQQVERFVQEVHKQSKRTTSSSARNANILIRQQYLNDQK